MFPLSSSASQWRNPETTDRMRPSSDRSASPSLNLRSVVPSAREPIFNLAWNSSNPTWPISSWNYIPAIPRACHPCQVPLLFSILTPNFSLFPSRHEKRVTPFVRQLLQSFTMPSGTFKLTDLYPNISASPRFIPVQSWLRVHEVTYDCIAEFQGPLRLMSMLISDNHPIGLYSAESGFGKSTLMKTLLLNLPHLRSISTGDRRSLLRDEFFAQNLPLLNVGKVAKGTKFVLWFEDAKDDDLEFIRSLIDQHSSDKQQSLNVVLTGHAFHSCPARFCRHFVPIKNWLEEFPAEAIRCSWPTSASCRWKRRSTSSDRRSWRSTGICITSARSSPTCCCSKERRWNNRVKAHRACRRRNKTNKSRWSSDCSATNPCRENRDDFADSQKNRRRIAINRIWLNNQWLTQS